MREIKFRAWDKQNNRFVSPVFMSMRGELFIDRDPYAVNMSGIRKISMLDPDRYITSQFTGLFDKNGKEIYEGDIVIDNRGRTCTVVFDMGMFVYVIISNKNKVGSLVSINDLCEVIGHIHENPELGGDSARLV